MWRNYDNYSVGAKWRHGHNLGDNTNIVNLVASDILKQDIFSLRGKYNYDLSVGKLSGWADLKYSKVNDTLLFAGGTVADVIPDGEYGGLVNRNYEYFELEAMPVAYTYGPVKAGWYVNHRDYTNADASFTEHQLRIYADLYKNEKLSVYGEYRFGLGLDIDVELGEHGSLDKYADTKLYKLGDMNQLRLGATYALSENMTLDGTLAYEMTKYNVDIKFDEDIDVDAKTKQFKIGAGITYRF